jgi:hypothetical protein
MKEINIEMQWRISTASAKAVGSEAGIEACGSASSISKANNENNGVMKS